MYTRQIELRRCIEKLICVITRGKDSPSNLLLSLCCIPLLCSTTLKRQQIKFIAKYSAHKQVLVSSCSTYCAYGHIMHLSVSS